LDRACRARKRIIYLQDLDGNAAGRGRAVADAVFDQHKVVGPSLLKRVEQRRYIASHRIATTHLIGFVQAAPRTLQDKIGLVSRAAFAFGNDVVDVENGCLSVLRELAILTASIIPLEDMPSKGTRNC
jgi:hypothetical protein